MKKILTFGILAVILIVALSACAGTNKPEDTNSKLEKTQFNLGYLNSTAHLLGFVAAEEGFFKEEGLTVTLSLIHI